MLLFFSLSILNKLQVGNMSLNQYSGLGVWLWIVFSKQRRLIINPGAIGLLVDVKEGASFAGGSA